MATTHTKLIEGCPNFALEGGRSHLPHDHFPTPSGNVLKAGYVQDMPKMGSQKQVQQCRKTSTHAKTRNLHGADTSTAQKISLINLALLPCVPRQHSFGQESY